ncbi:MAG TPA: hypothetical protein VKD72_27490 [Gemmataceae bacterium]|nr:hypothetical protein [Gemmataceae bacterium]
MARDDAFFPVALSFDDEHLLGPTAATWVAIERSRMAGSAVAMSLFMAVLLRYPEAEPRHRHLH